MDKHTLRCAALDGRGRQCRSTETTPRFYHGHAEIYHDGPEPSWLRVNLCAKHTGDAQPYTYPVPLRRDYEA